MNGKDLFTGLGEISQKYYEEAETAPFPRARKPFRKPLLAAALIAMTVLLAGCAVAYVMHMQDLKIGDQEATKPVIATDGIHIEGYEEINEQVLTLAGLKGSPGYQAAMEWFDFKQSYDPDREILRSVWGSEPEYPAEYSTYYIYSQEMKDALDAILAKYSLKPAGALLDFRTVENLTSALGIQKFFTTDNDVTILNTGGSCYENGNFTLGIDIGLPDDPDSDITATWGQIHWNRKDCFSDDTLIIEDDGNWQEWNYTTASGSEVLIMRSETHWQGWIFCDRPDGVLAVMMEARQDYGNNDGERSWWDYRYMSNRQMELVADAIDFGIQPKVATQEDVANQPGVPNEATQDGYTVELKSVETDGVVARVTLGLTAPEGTVINRDTREGHEGDKYHINSANLDKFTSVSSSGKTIYSGLSISPEEDGDGLDNTQDLVLTASCNMSDGEKPFAVGSHWTVRLEDLKHKDEILAQGEWMFDITIQESDGDFREIELIDEPIITKGCTGWTEEGVDVFEDVPMISFTLRAFSKTMVADYDTPVDFYDYQNPAYVVMKDGSRIELEAIGFDNPIDVTQLDYVLMGDGTKLAAPGA